MAEEIMIGDLIEVRFICALEDQASYNVRQWTAGVIVGLGLDMEEAAASVASAFATPYKTILCAAATFRGVGLRRLSPAPTLESFDNTGAGAGLVAGDPLPGQICGITKLVTVSPGRAGRGRSYFPFPAEAVNDVNGRPTLAHQVNMLAIANDFHSSIILDDGFGNSVNFSGVLTAKPGLTTKPLVGAIVRDTWATQRRRRIGVSGDTLPI